MRARAKAKTIHAHVCISPPDPAPSATPFHPQEPVEMASATDDDDAERRRRARALLDATTPGRSQAVGRCKLALETFRSDHSGDGLREARTLLSDALVCSNVHHPAIYRAWIGMELEAGTDASDVRELFEGWRIWYLRGDAKNSRDDDGGGDEEERRPSRDEGGFWCHYIDFELRHGTPRTARCVAERAVAACPRDPAVHAKYAKAELRLGCPDRAAAVLLSALDAFAADAGAREWLQKEVAAYGDSVRHGRSWGRLRGLLPSLCRRCRSRPALGYELLAVA